MSTATKQARSHSAVPPSFSFGSAYLEEIARRVERELRKDIRKQVKGQSPGRPQPQHLTDADIEIGTMAAVKDGQGQYVPVQVTDVYISPTSNRRAYDVKRLDDYDKKGFTRLEARKLMPKEWATVPARLKGNS